MLNPTSVVENNEEQSQANADVEQDIKSIGVPTPEEVNSFIDTMNEAHRNGERCMFF